MSFLYPAFLAGALAVAIPIVLHLLRRDVAPEVPFSAVRLLRKSPLEQTRRRRLRDWLLLAARIAAVLLLAFAFARPYFTAASAPAPLHIVAVDRSFSMGAPGRFDRALTLALEAVDAGSGGRIAVMTFDDRPEIVSAPGSAGEARAALRGLRPGFGGTRYAPLLSRAIELSDLGPARLTIVTDLQRAGWEDEEPVSIPAHFIVETRDAGESRANLAVVNVRREPRAIIATIRNGGAATANGQARVTVDERALASAPFSLAAGATDDVAIPLAAPDHGAVAVRIDDDGGYAADNVRYLMLDGHGKTRVLVVGDGDRAGFYLTRAIQAADDTGMFEVRVRAASLLGAADTDDVGTTAAVVILSTRGLDRRGRERLVKLAGAGAGMLIAAAPDVDPAALAALMRWEGFSAVERPSGGAVLAATDLRHPIFRTFGGLEANLGQVRFARAWLVRGEGWDVAARFTDGSPAVLERRDGSGRVVVFASDLDRRWNDFPLHSSFVPFAFEALRYVVSGTEAQREYVVGNAPPGTRAEPGAYTLAADGRRVIVNVDVRESATARMTAESFQGMLRTGQSPPSAPIERRAQQSEAEQNLWRYGVVLMLVALVVESAVGRVR